MKFYLRTIKAILIINILIITFSLALIVDLKPHFLDRHISVLIGEYTFTFLLIINISSYIKKIRKQKFDFIVPHIKGFDIYKLKHRRIVGFISLIILLSSLTFFLWHNVYVWHNFQSGFFLRQYRTVEYLYPLGLAILYCFVYVSYISFYFIKRLRNNF